MFDLYDYSYFAAKVGKVFITCIISSQKMAFFDGFFYFCAQIKIK